MAANRKTDEIWSVLIISREEKRCRVYNLPNSSSVAAVHHKWRSDFNLNRRSLLSCGGRRHSGSELLREVGEAAPGCQIVKFHVEEIVSLSVILPSSGQKGQVDAFLSQPPIDLHPLITRALQLPEDRYFRLSTASGLVRYDRSLEEQGIHEESQLQVDEAFEIVTVCSIDGTKEKWFMYTSERFCDVLTLAGGEWLKVDGRRIDVGVRLCDVVPHGHSGNVLKVHRVLPTTVSARCNDEMTTATVRLSENRFSIVRGQGIVDAAYRAVGGKDAFKKELCIDLREETVTFVVSLWDRCVRWTTPRRPMRHTQFMQVLAEKGGLKFSDIEETALTCVGCGRRIVKGEEAFQELPDRCCSVQSLRLTMQILSRDVGTQTRMRRTAETSIDTRCQTNPICPLVIFDYFQVDNSTNKNNTSVDVELPSNATVGDLRWVLSQRFNVDPVSLCLSLHSGLRVDDQRVIGASALDHSGWWGYYATDGELSNETDVRDWSWRLLSDDEDSFTPPTTVRTHLAVSLAPLRPFTIINDAADDEMDVTYLPIADNATVRDLKVAVTTLFDLPMEGIWISCTVPRSVLAFHVAMFNDPRPSQLSFDARLDNGDCLDGLASLSCWETFADESVLLPHHNLDRIRITRAPLRVFVVHNDCDDGNGHMFSITVPLHDFFVFEELRSALSMHMHRPAEELYLSRPVGVRRGIPVFGMYSSVRDNEWAFCDMTGEQFEKDTVSRWQWEALTDVVIPYHFPPDWINAVRVSPAPLAAFHVFYYGAARGMRELNVQLPLSTVPSVGEVRVAVARYLLTPEDNLKLSRRVGRRQGFFRGTEVFGVYDDQQPGRDMFCDGMGNEVSDVKTLEWKFLDRNSATFPMCGGRRIMILVDTNANRKSLTRTT